VIVGADLYPIEVWTMRGLVTFYTLFFIEHGSRIVHIAGSTCHPDESFMTTIAKGLTDEIDGFLRGKRFLIIDRDGKFAPRFKEILKEAGITIILAPYQGPNGNAFAERFVRSIKHECLNKVIHFGYSSLCRSLRKYAAHYNAIRNHQGVGNELLSGWSPSRHGDVVVKERLGGFLKFYCRKAA
jgi:putative transposase